MRRTPGRQPRPQLDDAIAPGNTDRKMAAGAGQRKLLMDKPFVLFVDDEIEFLQTLMKRMDKRGVAVFGVGSGEEALEWLAQNDPDVIVLDVKMPGMDGIQALREIKRTKPAIEVIMLTGHASLDAASEGMALGAFDYLMKPFNIDELFYKIQDACLMKRLQEEQNRHAESEAP
jgi:DNA-binding NtrC family response regulator